ncbi:MAG: YbjN domain-containing protein [Actinobacteria bacterium]|nr:YbjN domain-containing protein [Actinomycetota bacterium]MBV9936639.1 YbjN domain-containing protein [Actinomycetota bacterium]
MSDAAVATIESFLRDSELEYQRITPTSFAVNLPGEQRLRTACLLDVTRQALTIEAFVLRAPDENRAAVHEWMLRRNPRMYAVSWSIDDGGDVYLTGKVALAAVTSDEIDRILGAVLEYADGSFNHLLRLGFGDAIRREWAWRVKNGESLVNLEAFRSFASK